ncbi:MAG: hypothetical protein ABIK73_06915 [candidate division WOR-3 bacterium]
MSKDIDIDDAYNVVIDDLKPAIIVKINDKLPTGERDYAIQLIHSILRLLFDKYTKEDSNGVPIIKYIDVWQ